MLLLIGKVFEDPQSSEITFFCYLTSNFPTALTVVLIPVCTIESCETLKKKYPTHD